MFRSRMLSLHGVQPAVVVDPEGVEHEIQDPGQHRRRSRARIEIVGGWISDRLPEALGGRFSIGGRELGLIAVAAAVALCVAAGLALQSSARAAVPDSPARSGPAPVAASASPLAKPASKEVVVDVAGDVLHPGVVTLPAGSRVFQAVDAAGGAKPGVEVTSLNLARLLVDGEQVLVGGGGGAVQGARGRPESGRVGLNRATQADLETLPGVGPVTATNIIAWRTEHGAFTTVEELQEVTGIGPKTFAKLKSLVSP